MPLPAPPPAAMEGNLPASLPPAGTRSAEDDDNTSRFLMHGYKARGKGGREGGRGAAPDVSRPQPGAPCAASPLGPTSGPPRLQINQPAPLAASLQVIPCSKRYRHDWSVCPFAHIGEMAARRDPKLYLPIFCYHSKQARAPSRPPRWWLCICGRCSSPRTDSTARCCVRSRAAPCNRDSA